MPNPRPSLTKANSLTTVDRAGQRHGGWGGLATCRLEVFALPLLPPAKGLSAIMEHKIQNSKLKGRSLSRFPTSPTSPTSPTPDQYFLENFLRDSPSAVGTKSSPPASFG